MKPRLQIVRDHHSRTRSFTSIEDAVAAIRAGRMVIVVDDEDRENEGDLTIAAEKITPQVINFMALHGRGLICLAMTPEHLDALEIPLMVPHNSSRFETAFCVSIEAREGTTTGISAADRASTVLAAIHPETRPADLVRPGHIFPLRAKSAGVLARAGQTEAAVDLARLAGLHPSGVICEIMNKDGTMARVPQLRRFARRHNIPLVAIADLIAPDAYRVSRMYSCGCTRSVLPAMCCVPLVVTVALNSIKPCVGSRRKVVECCFTSIRKGEELVWPTRFALTPCRTKDSTP
jgi:3,4-dihydroxy-2-butanone 4-phosphate synthase